MPSREAAASSLGQLHKSCANTPVFCGCSTSAMVGHGGGLDKSRNSKYQRTLKSTGTGCHNLISRGPQRHSEHILCEILEGLKVTLMLWT